MKRLVYVSIFSLILTGLHVFQARAAPIATTVSGQWTVAPSMPAPLMSHQAVLLHDGRVLILGGESVLGVPTDIAQMYDPATGIWSIETSMHTARIGFTATVLLDGRVLVVGGIGMNMTDLASAELFDPQTNRWTVLPALPQTRFSQSASMLPDGRVLLVGGIVDHIISRSTFIFDPAHSIFVSGPPTHFAHAQQSALTIGNGEILIAGGYGGDPELFNPLSKTWKTVGSTPLRIHPIMTLLPGGSVLLAGGTSRKNRDLRSVQIFHPASDRWTDTASLQVRRNSESGALLPDGQVLVAGGEQVDHHLLKTAELYDASARVWRHAAPMHVARSGSTSTLLRNGALLVCGGGGFNGALSSCETFRLASIPRASTLSYPHRTRNSVSEARHETILESAKKGSRCCSACFLPPQRTPAQKPSEKGHAWANRRSMMRVTHGGIVHGLTGRWQAQHCIEGTALSVPGRVYRSALVLEPTIDPGS